MVVLVTFGAAFFRDELSFKALVVLILSNYGFKALVALIDTIPLYILVSYLRGYLYLKPLELAIPLGQEIEASRLSTDSAER